MSRQRRAVGADVGTRVDRRLLDSDDGIGQQGSPLDASSFPRLPAAEDLEGDEPRAGAGAGRDRPDGGNVLAGSEWIVSSDEAVPAKPARALPRPAPQCAARGFLVAAAPPVSGLAYARGGNSRRPNPHHDRRGPRQREAEDRSAEDPRTGRARVWTPQWPPRPDEEAGALHGETRSDDYFWLRDRNDPLCSGAVSLGRVVSTMDATGQSPMALRLAGGSGSQAVDLDSAVDVDDAGSVLAGREVAGLLRGPWAGALRTVADEEARVEDLEEEGGESQVKVARGENPPRRCRSRRPGHAGS